MRPAAVAIPPRDYYGHVLFFIRYATTYTICQGRTTGSSLKSREKMGIAWLFPLRNGLESYFFPARHFAQRALAAAAIFSLASGDI